MVRPSTWDQRTDEKLRGIGHSKAAPFTPREEEPGTQEDPESHNKIVAGFYGPTVVTVEELESQEEGS